MFLTYAYTNLIHQNKKHVFGKTRNFFMMCDYEVIKKHPRIYVSKCVWSFTLGEYTLIMVMMPSFQG